MLLTDFFDTIYLPRRLRGKSPNSVRLYRLAIRQLGLTLGRSPTIHDLDEDVIYMHLARRSNVAPATRNKELCIYLALWRLATKRKLLDAWPDIQAEQEPERAPIAWMPDEITRLLSAAGKMSGKIRSTPAKLYWPALIRTMLDTGERVGAIRAALWEWYSGGWLLVPAEARKGRVRDRRYRLSIATRAALDALRPYAGDMPEVFPWPFTPTYFHRRYKAVLVAAKLPTSRKYQTHCLRKTVGSVVHAAGMDAQDVLDHATRRDTKRYLDPRFSRDRQACDALSEYLGGGGLNGCDG